MAQRQGQYYGSIPQIAQAFQNDPRTKLAAQALAQGTSTAPVAGGGWAVTDGLARVAQAFAGAYQNKQQEKKYSAREQEYIDALKASAALAGQPQSQQQPMSPPNPAAANPAMVNPAQDANAQAAAALAGTPQPALQMGTSGQGLPRPIESFDPGPSAANQAPPLQMAQAAAPVAPQTQNGLPVGGTPGGARYGPEGAGNGRPRQAMNARALYYGGIVPIEGGTDPKTGAFRTSSAGAIGPGQVMPGTAPEAAKLAGLPFDDHKYRTDPDYNNALGEAYFTKQLETFGDPFKAAAAYNAGPGAVRTAMRKARQKGGIWEDYLPAETYKYLNGDEKTGYKGFKRSVGEGASINQDIEGVGMVHVAAPEMEAVPDRPQMPTQAERPGMPEVPPEVQSNRIAMAQQMLESGNPDMVAMAQAYLDQGLTEQFDARQRRNEHQYGRENMGYQTDLNDYGQARSDGRQDAYNRANRAEDRNFDREQGYVDRSFRAGESAAEREQRAREASAERYWRSNEAEEQRTWDAAQNEAARLGGGKNPMMDTIGGRKIASEITSDNQQIDQTVADMDRALDLLGVQRTGGVFALPGVDTLVGSTDEELDQLKGIFNAVTLEKIGGSLGVAISDGDRKFVEAIGPNLKSDPRANRAKVIVIQGGLLRKRDFNSVKLRYLEEGRPLYTFEEDWRRFANSVPLVRYDSKNRPIYSTNVTTFDEWMKSRPRYDANGNKVN